MLTALPMDLPVFADPELRKLTDALVADRERLNKAGALLLADTKLDNSPIGSEVASTGDFTTLRGQRAVTAVATGSNRNITTDETRTVFTNEGATVRQDLTLPAAAAGLEYGFYCQDGDGIRVIAGAGDTLRFAGNVSAAGGRLDSITVGSAITLVAINATEWVALSYTGTWTAT